MRPVHCLPRAKERDDQVKEGCKNKKPDRPCGGSTGVNEEDTKKMSRENPYMFGLSVSLRRILQITPLEGFSEEVNFPMNGTELSNGHIIPKTYAFG